MINVISAALWGRDPFFVEGALINAVEAKKFYPGWEFWIYVNRGHIAISRLKQVGARVIEMPICQQAEGMAWRFLPTGEPNVERVIFRDVDCRFSWREVDAVNEWVESDRAVHAMHDSWHTWARTNVPLLGGLWGVRLGKLPPVIALYREWLKLDPLRIAYGDDQAFLFERVWPLVERQDIMVHTSCPVTKAMFQRVGIEPRGFRRPVDGQYEVGDKVPIWRQALFFPSAVQAAFSAEKVSDIDLVGALFSIRALVEVIYNMGPNYEVTAANLAADLARLEAEAVARGVTAEENVRHYQLGYGGKFPSSR